MTLGRHFALTSVDEYLLLHTPEPNRPELIGDDIEERYTEEWCCDTDKSWDAIHRSFNKSQLNYEMTDYLQGIILGGQPLFSGTDYVISYKTIGQTVKIAAAVSNVTKSNFRERYFGIDTAEYGFPTDEDDFLYSWENLEELKAFYQRAARSKRCVIYTAAQ